MAGVWFSFLVALPLALTLAAGEHAPSGLPAGAVQCSAYAWRYTDMQGKEWLYRQTPFGLVKIDRKQDEQVAPESKIPTTVSDLGEAVRFERNTPFGRQNWTRKKSELTDEEAALLKNVQEKE